MEHVLVPSRWTPTARSGTSTRSPRSPAGDHATARRDVPLRKAAAAPATPTLHRRSRCDACSPPTRSSPKPLTVKRLQTRDTSTPAQGILPRSFSPQISNYYCRQFLISYQPAHQHRKRLRVCHSPPPQLTSSSCPPLGQLIKKRWCKVQGYPDGLCRHRQRDVRDRRYGLLILRCMLLSGLSKTGCLRTRPVCCRTHATYSRSRSSVIASPYAV